jgi:hypothetical protein
MPAMPLSSLLTAYTFTQQVALAMSKFMVAVWFVVSLAR